MKTKILELAKNGLSPYLISVELSINISDVWKVLQEARLEGVL